MSTSATRSHDLLEAWPDLYRCVEEHGPSLSLPEGVTSPTQVIDASLQHRLWLQFCFAELAGLGKRDKWRLDKKEQRERIDGFLDRLRGYRSTVEFLKLTADKLLEMLVLPEAERELLVQELRSQLGLRSMNELIDSPLRGRCEPAIPRPTCTTRCGACTSRPEQSVQLGSFCTSRRENLYNSPRDGEAICTTRVGEGTLRRSVCLVLVTKTTPGCKRQHGFFPQEISFSYRNANRSM